MKSLIFQPEKAQWLHELGRVAMTRRIVKVQPPEDMSAGFWYPRVPRNDKDKSPRHYAHESHWRKGGWMDFAPHKVGDRLYVKEPWRPYRGVHKEIIEYRDGGFIIIPRELDAHPELDLNAEHLGLTDKGEHWRNPLFMPEWAARTILTVTRVRIERARDITEQDAILEGMQPQAEPIPCWSFRIWLDEAHTKFGSGHCYSVDRPPEESPVGYGRFDIRQNGWTEPETAVQKFEHHFTKLNGPDAWERWVWIYGTRTVEIR